MAESHQFGELVGRIYGGELTGDTVELTKYEQWKRAKNIRDTITHVALRASGRRSIQYLTSDPTGVSCREIYAQPPFEAEDSQQIQYVADAIAQGYSEATQRQGSDASELTLTEMGYFVPRPLE